MRNGRWRMLCIIPLAAFAVAACTPTPQVQCTPPACWPGEVFYCPGRCPGGCGTICATVTPGGQIAPAPTSTPALPKPASTEDSRPLPSATPTTPRAATASPSQTAPPASTATPSPTQASTLASPTLQAPTKSAGPCIMSFSISPDEVKPGEPITITWQAMGDEAFIFYQEEFGSLSTGIAVPLSDSITISTDPSRRDGVPYMLSVRSGKQQVSAGADIWLTCPTTWFFRDHPQICPGPATHTTIVAQYFEHGMMLWSSSTRSIDVLIATQPGYFSDSTLVDQWQEGMPESDPTITPPPGFLQPVRGFGLAWRSIYKDSLDSFLVRDRLGWATAKEFTVGEGYMQGWARGKYSSSFMTGPNNTVIEFPRPYGTTGGAQIVPTSTPGPSPTRVRTTPAAVQLGCPAPPSPTPR
jgi:hypothetical protein